MEELCHEQLVHLARHSVLWGTYQYALNLISPVYSTYHGVIGQIGGGLVG
jgi:hypothetical protein